MPKFDHKEREIMETAGVNKILQLFNMLSKSDQLKIADRIDKQTFEERWLLLDNTLPNTEISDEDIMKEVRAIRYGSKKD
jgi:hypothetical protein